MAAAPSITLEEMNDNCQFDLIWLTLSDLTDFILIFINYYQQGP